MPCSGVGICAASRVFRVEEHPTSSEAINAPATVFVHALIEIRFGVWVLKASELSARWRNYTKFNENGYIQSAFAWCNTILPSTIWSVSRTLHVSATM